MRFESISSLCILYMLNWYTALTQPIPDISGEWTGTAKVGKSYLSLEMDIDQDGLILDAIGFQKSMNEKDSMKYRLKGAIDVEEVRLEGTDIIYKTGLSCLSILELTYKEDDNTESLTGIWKGDWRLTTCPPGVSGDINLIRSISVNSVKTNRYNNTKTQQIGNDDYIGVELKKALSERKYYAILIGINEYKDEKIQKLDNPIQDAQDLKKVLLDYYSFDDNNIILLENPTREEIIEQLDKLNSVITEKDQLLVFYAGHGIWDGDLNQGYWLPSDAKMNSKAQWLSNSTIRDYIGGIKSKHTLLITDACFSGSIFKERAVYSESRAILEMYKLKSRKAMTSGAMKTVPDKSVFIEYLLKTLVNNEQPFLSSDDLFRRFKPAVMNNSVNGQVPQYGPIRLAGDEGGEFIFLRRME